MLFVIIYQFYGWSCPVYFHPCTKPLLGTSKKAILLYSSWIFSLTLLAIVIWGRCTKAG